ncbi:26S proteasome non-ATPase regulatory subunit 5 [Bactrocera neohumeralis]|uniref:26S proteasome non-ATPase regulatory subunit 5 n=1 Tax=Bactrocera tryoni TaxID=59916 RepID=UPI001A98FD18|nr:26S proteasome non-ATPase regulatory subunit 5 [Bactrocera tryoni]XP_050332645.1 26S proteasome non-ATPase regulatory subunit 5 [Bactrocera neohumeralis]
MNENWFCEQISNLNIQENRLTALSEIRMRLYEINETSDVQLETQITDRLLNAPEFIECLNCKTEAKEQCELAADILAICMSHMSLGQSTLPTILELTLTHPRSSIKSVVFNTILKQLERQRNSNKNVQISSELLIHILNGLKEDDSKVGVPAIGILTIVLEQHINDEGIKSKLLDMLTSNEIVKCRVYELAVNLAKQSPTMLHQVEFLLDRALSELDNDDVLFQVNILEILVALAEQNHGLLYLENRQVFEIISRRVENVDQNPIDQLLIPGIMKFFGKTASVQPQKVIVDYPHMIHCLFESILSGNMSILPAAFDTFANLNQTTKGKQLLDQNYPALIKETFEAMGSYLRNLSIDLKNRAFNTLEMVFSTESSNQTDIEGLLHKWFKYLAGEESMQFLMDYCRNPFPDIKVACLSFIKSLCLHKWGLLALKNTAGFVEFLLDRKIEFDKDAKYKKFELISLLADTDVFDMQINLQLRTYVNEGPYFVQSILDIATEGN